MPFTPFHMGPALGLKAFTGRYFSVLVFGIAQVAMDIEPGIGMLRGADVLHGWSHTWIGATLIGLLVVLIAPPICRPILARWNRELEHHRLRWLVTHGGIGWLPTITGAFIGTYSHIVLDSVMHADMAPFAPWSRANTLLNLVSIETLQWFCVAAGLFGVAAWFGYKRWKRIG